MVRVTKDRPRIGVLGGTFDPTHIGHLILGEYTVEALGLSHVLFVPAADPPHKQDNTHTPVVHRLAMLELAVTDNQHFSVSRVDIDRDGPHYSVDMMKIVQAQYPDAELFFVMGGDSLRDLPTWDRPLELVALCKLAVMRRSHEELHPQMHEAILPGLAERIVMIDAPMSGIWISSTDILERLITGKSVRYIVPDSVLSYIYKHHLYRVTK